MTEIKENETTNAPDFNKTAGIGCLIAIPILILIVIIMSSGDKKKIENNVRDIVENAVRVDFPRATNVLYGNYEINEGHETFSQLKTDIATLEVSMTDGTEKKVCYYWLERVDNEDWRITDIRGCNK